MQILRVPPYNATTVKLDYPITVDGNFVIKAIDMADSSEIIIEDGNEYRDRNNIIPNPPAGFTFMVSQGPSGRVYTFNSTTIDNIYIPKEMMKYDTDYKIIIEGNTTVAERVSKWSSSPLNNAYIELWNLENSGATDEEIEDFKKSEEYLAAENYINSLFGESCITCDTEILFEDYLTVIRPYINPNDHGTTASEIATYASNEELARAIIDSVCDVEFYYKKKIIQTTGQGTDYLPIWVDAKKVLKVYENNVLLYDADDLENSVSAFEIIPDGSAITMTFNDAINRDESARILLPASPTDITELDYSARGFPKTWDYTVILEVGYNKVPSDIVRATELLIHDIDCGKLDYYKRYIGAYNTDQFRIQFDKAVFEGTGNLIVDKILDKYRKPIEFVGVL